MLDGLTFDENIILSIIHLCATCVFLVRKRVVLP